MIFDADTRSLLSDLLHTRVKDPSLVPIFNELSHLAEESSRTLIRQQPAEKVPEKGRVIEFHWDIFQSPDSPSVKEPGDGEFTLLFFLSKTSSSIPIDDNSSIVKGSFQIEEVTPSPDDPQTYTISLRELV